jgi:hypothetical protein
MPIADLEDVAAGIVTLPAASLSSSPRPGSPDSVHSLGSDLSDWSSDTSSMRSDSPVMIEHEDAESRPATPDSARSLGSDWSDISDSENFGSDSEFVFLSPQELAASLSEVMSESRSESPVMVEHKDAEVDSVLSSSWSDIGSEFHTPRSVTPVAANAEAIDYDLTGLNVMGAANIAEVNNIDYDLRGLDVMAAASIAEVNNVDYDLRGLDVMGAANIADAALVRVNPQVLNVNAPVLNVNPPVNVINNPAAVFNAPLPAVAINNLNAPVTQKVKVKMGFSKPMFAKIMTEKGELVEYPEEEAYDIDKVIIES